MAHSKSTSNPCFPRKTEVQRRPGKELTVPTGFEPGVPGLKGRARAKRSLSTVSVDGRKTPVDLGKCRSRIFQRFAATFDDSDPHAAQERPKLPSKDHACSGRASRPSSQTEYLMERSDVLDKWQRMMKPCRFQSALSLLEWVLRARTLSGPIDRWRAGRSLRPLGLGGVSSGVRGRGPNSRQSSRAEGEDQRPVCPGTVPAGCKPHRMSAFSPGSVPPRASRRRGGSDRMALQVGRSC